MTQGFQCTSPTMSTARTARSQKLYDKSIDAYEKELKANPNNADAHYELAEVLCDDINMNKETYSIREKIKKLESALDHAFKGKEVNKLNDEKTMQKYYMINNNLWIFAYNLGGEVLNAISAATMKQEEKVELAQAVEPVLEKSVTLVPHLPNTYNLLGVIYITTNENDKAIKAYSGYNRLLTPEIKFAKDKGIYLGISRDEIITKLGKPVDEYPHPETIKKDSKQPSDTVFTYVFKTNSGMLAVWTSYSDKTKENKVFGWKFNPNYSLIISNYEINIDASMSLFGLLLEKEEKKAENKQKPDYTEALKVYEVIKTLDPNNTVVDQQLVQIYKNQGEKDKALALISKLVKDQPTNKVARAQYGDILREFNKEDEAIAQYEEALKIDPQYTDVLRILGSLYKNKAVEAQSKEIEKYEQDQSYKINEAAYIPFLDKALVKFETVADIDKADTDINVYLDLADIYFAKKATDKFNALAAKLESKEATILPENKEQFLYDMLRLFTNAGNQEKVDKFTQKIEALKK